MTATHKQNFTDVVVIYNPNSTGPGKALATELKKEVTSYDIRIIATKYAGHADELAKASPRPLIISASGDGGYHEIVNGLIRAQQEGFRPNAGLLPAGNANDHYHDLEEPELAKSIAAGKTRNIDLLKLTTTVDG